jgi:hypothetical protein
MHTLHRLACVLALLPVLACDKDEETPCNEAHFEASRACGDGVAFCGTDPDSEAYSWGICVEAPECMPEDNSAGTCEQCQLDDEGVPYIDYSACGGDTPLVLSFDGAAVEYGSGGRPFALGRCAATDWPTAETPWLALDRDHSGQIDGGHELFGSATRLRGGQLADQGFAALAELDANGDGTISSDDPGFAELVLWADHDGDRRSTGLELQPLAAMGLVAIELGYTRDRRCDARDNCEVERAAFTWRDALGRDRTGEVVDVHLACQ